MTKFGLLRDFGIEIFKQNRGTTFKMQVSKHADGKYIFKFLYLCLGNFKRGSLEGCRRVISTDACFLKRQHNSQLFVAGERYTNDCVYPIEYTARRLSFYKGKIHHKK